MLSGCQTFVLTKIFCQVPRSSALLLVALAHAETGQAFGYAASGQLA